MSIKSRVTRSAFFFLLLAKPEIVDLVPESDISFSKFPVSRHLLKLFYDELRSFSTFFALNFDKKLAAESFLLAWNLFNSNFSVLISSCNFDVEKYSLCVYVCYEYTEWRHWSRAARELYILILHHGEKRKVFLNW
jgi:hypothetical protein